MRTPRGIIRSPEVVSTVKVDRGPWYNRTMKKDGKFHKDQVWTSSDPTSKVSVRVTDVDKRGQVHYEWVTYRSGQPVDPNEVPNGRGSQKETLRFFTDDLKLVPRD